MPAHAKKYSKRALPYTTDEVKSKVNSKEAVDLWIEYSMSPHSEEELRDKLLGSLSDICVSYVCRYSLISEEFIFEFTGLTTGLFNKGTYDKDVCIELGKYLMMNKEGKDKVYTDIKLYKQGLLLEDNLPEGLRGKPALYLDMFTTVLRDKVDWYYIEKYQNYSLAFRKKYTHLFNNTKKDAYEKSYDTEE